jgi:carboxylesterase type B
MSADKQAMVATKSGKLEGIVENGLYVFKGIPFAEPPHARTHSGWSHVWKHGSG